MVWVIKTQSMASPRQWAPLSHVGSNLLKVLSLSLVQGHGGNEIDFWSDLNLYFVLYIFDQFCLLL